MDYSKFNSVIDLEGLKADLEKGTTEYEEIPAGDYEVSIESLELGETKETQKPMVKCRMKILVGDYEGRLLFFNKPILNAWFLSQANEFLDSLKSGHKIELIGWEQYGELIKKVFESVSGKHEYLVELSKKVSKGKTYDNYTIKKVYDI